MRKKSTGCTTDKAGEAAWKAKHDYSIQDTDIYAQFESIGSNDS